MATQAVRLLAPSGLNVTIDLATLASDTLAQTAIVCTEATNRKGLYVSANFTDTLAGRHLIVKKAGGVVIGSDFVVMAAGSGTYDSEELMAATGDASAANQATIIAALAQKPTLAEILGGGDADGLTIEQALKICLAALAGKMNRAGAVVTFRAADDSRVRITATTDSAGRTAVTLDPVG